MIKDGWHDITDSIKVYTEDGMILRAISGETAASIYKWDARLGCRTNALPMRYDTFRKGWREDRYEVR